MDSVSEGIFLGSNVIATFSDNLIKERDNLMVRLNEIEELIEVGHEDIVYLLKDTDSKYCYMDVYGVKYKYIIANQKHILLNTHNYKSYEILEYCPVKNIQYVDSTSKWKIDSYVDKVVKIVEL